MKKSVFFSKLKDDLMIESEVIDETTQVQLTSLTILVIIVFIYENFNKQVSGDDLKNIKNIADLIKLIGSENLE